MDKRNILYPDENREILTISAAKGHHIYLALYAKIYVDDIPYYFTLDMDSLEHGDFNYLVVDEDEEQEGIYHIVLDGDIETSVFETFKKMLTDYQNK